MSRELDDFSCGLTPEELFENGDINADELLAIQEERINEMVLVGARC